MNEGVANHMKKFCRNIGFELAYTDQKGLEWNATLGGEDKS
jgi:hypothetical protein